MENNNEEIYYPQSPTRYHGDEENVFGESLFVVNPNSNPFDVPTTSTSDAFAPSNNGMEFDYTNNETVDESFLPPQLAACSHSYPDNINEFVVQNLDELLHIGKVFNVVEKKVLIEVVVDKNAKVNDLVSQNNVNLRENNSLDPNFIRKQLKLQVGALLFTKEGKPIGKITDIFGTVSSPFYVLTYPNISTMRTVFNLPEPSSTNEATNEKKESAQPPSTPTKQKQDKLTTPKKKPATNDEKCVDDFFDLPDPRDLKIVELKPYLQRRGLSPWGKKKSMIAKIRKYERDKRKERMQNPSGNDIDSDISSDSESSEEEGETLFTPKKQPATSSNGERFALRSLKDLEGMESDDEEHDTKRDEKKTNSSTEKLSQSEVARIKEFGLVYCHNLHSAQLDETSTQHMILNHTKAYDAMFNSDDKTEVMTFSDDEDESAFKHHKKEERKNPPPPVPVLKRKYDEAIQPTNQTVDEADTPSKVSKKLPFIDISEAKQSEKAHATPEASTEINNTPSTIVEEVPKPQITPKQHTKSTPKSTKSSARKPRAKVYTTTQEEPSFFTKWCSIM